MLTVELGGAGSTNLLNSTFPWYAIFASVGRLPLYEGQLGAGPFVGFLAKFASAVWKLWDSLTSAAVAVERLYVPKRRGTAERQTREQRD